jgi:hypothetical protein
LSDDNGLWGPFIEKAVAKLHGNFVHINGGDPSEAVMTLNGGEKVHLAHNGGVAAAYNLEKSTPEEIFDELFKYDVKRAIMMTGTEASPGGDSDKSANGLYLQHAYTVLGAYKLKNGEKLIKVRNPHGNSGDFDWDGGYKGRWHDNDSYRWTEEILRELNYTPKNDGTFFIDMQEFADSFTETWINPSTL